jgi:hypothetical protein
MKEIETVKRGAMAARRAERRTERILCESWWFAVEVGRREDEVRKVPRLRRVRWPRCFSLALAGVGRLGRDAPEAGRRPEAPWPRCLTQTLTSSPLPDLQPCAPSVAMAAPFLRSAAGSSLLPVVSRRLAVPSCASQRLALRRASHLASSRGHAASSLRPPPVPLPRLLVRCYATPAEPPLGPEPGARSSSGPSAQAGQPSRAAMADAARKEAYKRRNQSLLLYTAATVSSSQIWLVALR